MNITSQQYDSVIAICRSLFINKMKDYGSAWRILRLPSLTDQIFIKAQRIRSLQENEVRKLTKMKPANSSESSIIRLWHWFNSNLELSINRI